MAGRTPRLRVVISTRALKTLDKIWDWNAKKYNAEHAQDYIDFLKRKARGLATGYLVGKIVPSAPELRYLTIKRSPRGHGHVAVYHIYGDVVEVANFYHTAQDWQSKLARGEW